MYPRSARVRCSYVTTNPYAPPRSKSATELRLFTARAVAINTLVVPALGGVLAVLNYRRLGDKRGAWKATLLLLLPGTVLLAFGVVTVTGHPEGYLAFALVQVARAGLSLLAFLDQRSLVRAHFAAGGRKARWALPWLVVLPAFVVAFTVWKILLRGPMHTPRRYEQHLGQ
jgi:hypothetical protein